ncbi:OmpA family protein [Adhaeribacter soli]|uniref:OmpA family protein n=2 Tax=Adhaeribacter soli TaxID=2607655 RepID=A0A5N1J2T9_9BACT|nr:OmpA family protein [Adhaeribacter soli]
MKYPQAIAAYKKLLDEKEPSLEVLEGLGNSYRQMNNNKEAEFWYAQTMNFPKVSVETQYNYAEALRRNEKYERAKEVFQQVLDKDKTKAEQVNQLITACDQALAWQANPKRIDIKKEHFNSENSDFSPVFYKKGLVFSSDRDRKTKMGMYSWTGKPYLQLYTIQQDSTGNWSAPAALPNRINSSFHNAAATFSASGDTIFFTRTNKEPVRRRNGNSDPTSWQPVPAKDQFLNRLEIFTSEFKGDAWTAAKPFAYNNHKEYSVGHPALSPDGKLLYFVSDMPGGKGQTDLYFCERQANGSWSKPVNCGPTVNTPGKETFPVVAADGTLYFSSDGHVGMGGLDLFSVQGSRDQWNEVKNMEPPFNSGADDFGIVFEPGTEKGYFSSNRNSETGVDNIYSFKPEQLPCKLDGRVMEQPVAQQLQAKPKPIAGVMLRLYKPGDSIPQTTYSDADGNFTFPITAGIEYTIKGVKSGYLTKSSTITPDCKSVVDMIKIDMAMNKNKMNYSYVVENIYYDLDKFDIRPDAAKELDKMVVMLKDNPNIKIELSSHTDSRQTQGYNKLLSQLRAEAAVKYMILQGIDARRLKAKGYGETKLRNRCKDNVQCSEEEHQLNRRTEFKLIR